MLGDVKYVTDELEALQEKHQILTGLQQSCRDVKRQKKVKSKSNR